MESNQNWAIMLDLVRARGAIRRVDGWYWGYHCYGIDWKGRFIGSNAREALEFIISESESSESSSDNEWLELARKTLYGR